MMFFPKSTLFQFAFYKGYVYNRNRNEKHADISEERKQRMKKAKSITCIIGVILLIGLYIITLIFSITDNTQAKSWLSASLYATVAVPILLYAFLLITRQLKNRNQEAADLEENESEEGTDKIPSKKKAL